MALFSPLILLLMLSEVSPSAFSEKKKKNPQTAVKTKPQKQTMKALTAPALRFGHQFGHVA